jgi:hypothetical protein
VDLDLVARTLSFTVALENLAVSGPAVPLVISTNDAKAGGAGDHGGDVPRARFDTTPVFDVLDKDKVLLAPVPDAAGSGASANAGKDEKRGG